jgi:hypothetical protein
MDNIDGELQGVEETLAATRDFVDKEEKAIPDALQFVLKSMVNYVKVNGPWIDRTANLRNSISANIEAMKEWPADTDPSTLESKAQELEKPVIDIKGDDYYAVLSAGMEYAIYLETGEGGMWVLTGAIDKFEPLIEKYLAGYLSVEKLDLEHIASVQNAKKYGK